MCDRCNDADHRELGEMMIEVLKRNYGPHPEVSELQKKHIQERKELLEKQAREREEEELAPHQREGWMSDSFLEDSSAHTDVTMLRDAILSLQSQIDELREELDVES